MAKGIKASILMAISLASVGCVTSRPVALPSGQRGLAIHCSGTARSWSDCMNEAGAQCGGAYDVISANGENVGGVVNQAGNTAVFAHAIHREMIVACKNP